MAYVSWQALEGAFILLAVCIFSGLLHLSIAPRSLLLYFVTGTLNVSIPICILSFVAPKVPAGVLSLGLMLIPTMILRSGVGFRHGQIQLGSLDWHRTGFCRRIAGDFTQTSLPSGI